jgi:hypothetical protein
METIRRLCNRIIVLDHGTLQLDTKNIAEAVGGYLENSHSETKAEWINQNEHGQKTEQKYESNPFFMPSRFRLTDARRNTIEAPILSGDDVQVVIEGMIEEPNPNVGIGYVLFTDDGVPLFTTSQQDTMTESSVNPVAGSVTFISKLPTHWLLAGTYTLALSVYQYQTRYFVDPGQQAIRIVFRVEGVPGNSPYRDQPRLGYLAPVIPWTIWKGQNEF